MIDAEQDSIQDFINDETNNLKNWKVSNDSKLLGEVYEKLRKKNNNYKVIWISCCKEKELIKRL